MNYVPRGPKKPVNMTLSEDLVREARLLTRNLSDTVEHVARGLHRQPERARQRRTRSVASTNASRCLMTTMTGTAGSGARNFRHSDGAVRRPCEHGTEP